MAAEQTFSAISGANSLAIDASFKQGRPSIVPQRAVELRRHRHAQHPGLAHAGERLFRELRVAIPLGRRRRELARGERASHVAPLSLAFRGHALRLRS